MCGISISRLNQAVRFLRSKNQGLKRPLNETKPRRKRKEDSKFLLFVSNNSLCRTTAYWGRQGGIARVKIEEEN